MLNLLRKVDLFGTSEFFNYKSQPSYKSHWGAFMTLIMLALVTAVSAYYITVLVDKSKPNIFYQQYKGFNQKTYFQEKDTNEGMFPIFIDLFYNDGSAINFSTIKVNLFYLTNSDMSTIFKIPGEMCNLNNFPQYAKESFKKDNIIPLNADKTKFEYDSTIEKYFCFNTTGKNISDFYNSDLGNMYITVNYVESDKEILANDPLMYMQLFALYSDYDLETYENVFTRYVKYSGQLTLSNALQKNYLLKFQKVIIDTDIGWLSSEIQKQNSFMMGDIYPNENYEIASGTFQLKLQIILDEYSQYYKRTYMKLQECLALIGGLQSQLSIMFSLLLTQMSKVRLKVKLMNEIFKFPETIFDTNYQVIETKTIKKEMQMKNKKPRIKEHFDTEKHPQKHEIHLQELQEIKVKDNGDIIEENPKIVNEFNLKDLNTPPREDIEKKDENERNFVNKSSVINDNSEINIKPKRALLSKYTGKIEEINIKKLTLSFFNAFCLILTPCCIRNAKNRIKKDIIKKLDDIIMKSFDITEIMHLFIDTKRLNYLNDINEDPQSRNKFPYNETYKMVDYVQESFK